MAKHYQTIQDPKLDHVLVDDELVTLKWTYRFGRYYTTVSPETDLFYKTRAVFDGQVLYSTIYRKDLS